MSSKFAKRIAANHAKKREIEVKSVILNYSLEDFIILNQEINAPDSFSYENDMGSLTNNYSIGIEYLIHDQTIEIIFEYNLYFKTVDTFKLKTANIFKVKNWLEVIPDQEEKHESFFREFSKSDFMAKLVETSMSHTRGVHAFLIKGSVIAKLFIPQINAKRILEGEGEFAKRVFDN